MRNTQLIELDGQPEEQLEFFHSWIAKAAKEGVVRPLPNSKNEFSPSALTPGHLRILRNRLYRLGYLTVDTKKDVVDPELQQAIRQFQMEAGLTSDGWLGAQTWQALQELFAFEPHTDWNRWYTDLHEKPVLGRAINLRLITFGLIKEKSQASATLMTSGLQLWSRVLELIDGNINRSSENKDHLKRLFDLDQLLVVVHRNRSSIRSILTKGPRHDRELLKRFLVCWIKIELWLLGYEGVKPDGVRSPIKRRRIVRILKKDRFEYTTLYQVIRRFWDDRDLSKKHPPKEANILLRTLSGLFAIQAEEIDESTERRTQATELIDTLNASDRNLDNDWKDASFGSRLWDGAKRLWRFLSKWAKRAASVVFQKIKLVIRAAYHAAAEAFSILHRGFRIFTDTIDLLISNEISGSSKEVAMAHDRDFDFHVFVAATATKGDVELFYNHLQNRLASFHSTIRIIKIALSIAITGARIAAGPWGWWPLIRTLIDFYGEYKDEDARLVQSPLLA